MGDESSLRLRIEQNKEEFDAILVRMYKKNGITLEKARKELDTTIADVLIPPKLPSKGGAGE